MSNSFVQAVNQAQHKGKTQTQNGATVRKSSGDHVLNLFSKIGSMRDVQPQAKIKMFWDAYNENSELAIRVLLWSRDVLQGAGERETFRQIFQEIAKVQPKVAEKLIPKVPELGRWDDLIALNHTSVNEEAIKFWFDAAKSGNQLAAKWLPREGSKHKQYARHIMRVLGLTPKQYRNILVQNTNVTEQAMCANKWKDIIYSHVPSKAMSVYHKAFQRQDSERFNEFTTKVEKGEVKVNAKALFPHELLNKVGNQPANQERILEAQWQALPNFVKEGYNILPMCDVSGSMGCYGGLPLQVSLGLGAYIAERNTSAFKDLVLTFSESPTWVTLTGSLAQRKYQLARAPWGNNTDLGKAFMSILDMGVKNKVPQEDMPNMILVITDGQFDRMVIGKSENQVVTKQIKHAYKQAGYEVPKIVFWNVNATLNMNQSITKQHEENVCEVSGFSPAILTAILDNDLEQFTPFNVMLKTIMKDRYNY